MRKSLVLAAVVSALAASSPLLAQTQDVVVASKPGVVGVAQTIEVSATITKIDKASRGITLKGPSGNEVTLIAGPEVKNFDQLKVGDTVRAAYLESLVLELKKGGGLPVKKTEKTDIVTAKPGERPGGAGGRQVKAVGNVIKVDAATQTVTVKGENRTIDLKVRDPEQFKLIAVGDQIEATYTEATAVAVTPAAPAKK
jgi:Cu/Ag efflux protein CusF